jgi:hypothetical protein
MDIPNYSNPLSMTQTFLFLPPLIETSISYAGIGSRCTPSSILNLMERIALILAQCGLVLRSGGAVGADLAFEKGCDRAFGKKEIFLPWGGFNGSDSPLFPPSNKAEALAASHHPNWEACTHVARKFHARNCQQVLGKALNDPVDFVLFGAPETNGVVEGGTAMSVRLARQRGIPAFNLWDNKTRANWTALVKASE